LFFFEKKIFELAVVFLGKTNGFPQENHTQLYGSGFPGENHFSNPKLTPNCHYQGGTCGPLTDSAQKEDSLTSHI
jgi:hypothetical protein